MGSSSHVGPPRGARGPRWDCLKKNSVQMKRSELKTLRKLVRSGETRKLSAADLALLLRLRFALREYEALAGQGGKVQD